MRPAHLEENSAYYDLPNLMNPMIKARRIRDENIMSDTTPEMWRDSDIMKEAGRKKFLAIVQEVKDMTKGTRTEVESW